MDSTNISNEINNYVMNLLKKINDVASVNSMNFYKGDKWISTIKCNDTSSKNNTKIKSSSNKKRKNNDDKDFEKKIENYFLNHPEFLENLFRTNKLRVDFTQSLKSDNEESYHIGIFYNNSLIAKSNKVITFKKEQIKW